MAMFWTDMYQSIIFVETKKGQSAVAILLFSYCRCYFQPNICATFVLSNTAALWSSDQTKRWEPNHEFEHTNTYSNGFSKNVHVRWERERRETLDTPYTLECTSAKFVPLWFFIELDFCRHSIGILNGIYIILCTYNIKYSVCVIHSTKKMANSVFMFI